MTAELFADAEVIHRYTRTEAIADGALIDITKTTTEAGISIPVAMTAAAHADCVAWNEQNASYQDEDGRLWDVTTMLRIALLRNAGESTTDFQVLRIPNEPRASVARLADLRASLGGGDMGEPVLTIMLPGED